MIIYAKVKCKQPLESHVEIIVPLPDILTLRLLIDCKNCTRRTIEMTAYCTLFALNISLTDISLSTKSRRIKLIFWFLRFCVSAVISG